jgi:transcription antitermination factor NusG
MGGEIYQQTGWCVLRTASRHTMRLAETLAGDGYEVWTPIETRMIRIPRKNVKREVKLPIMPSYVFAKAHQLVDLLLLADAADKARIHGVGAHSDFDVMRAFGRIPLVPDPHLTALRRLETKLTPKPKAEKTFIPGVIVKVGGGSFGGMTGRVERSDAGYTLVCLNDRYSVKIPTLLLKQDDVCDQDGIGLQEAA